jgi:hypothetical protein
MSNFLQYRMRQDAVYAEFKTNMCSLTQLHTSPYVGEPKGGYLIAFRHNNQFMDRVTTFSSKISACIPSLRYTHSNLHTTITVYQHQPLQHFQPDRNILDTLHSTCQRIDQDALYAVSITFQEWLFNREAVIVAGQPNDAFWAVAESVQEQGKYANMDLRMPWGAHVTVARYMKDSEAVKELTSVVDMAPALGESRPTSIWVGYHRTTSDGVDFVPHSIIDISR